MSASIHGFGTDLIASEYQAHEAVLEAKSITNS